ncbi:MAG: hypothetical protein ACLVJ6_08360 [Merdibacter sp.]
MLLLLTLFVGCSFVTIERCASFYQRMLREQRQDDRVQLPYLVLFNRLQGVSSGQVRVQRIEDQECLVIREQIEDRTYDGVLCSGWPDNGTCGRRTNGGSERRGGLGTDRSAERRSPAALCRKGSGTAALGLELKEGAE